ncbi:unnamed protein product [Symbiodinium necroappetens]|uniref:Uncharacterized protein n=1 Tax=Symbiodinium necroappetens TaxID=1628268 RepID=A0A812P5P8_9DINO|nr:unnamed protein product [Symbiodinium necroappetens]
MSLCHGSALEEISGDVVELAVIDVMGLDSQTLNHLWECSEVHKFNRVEVCLHLLQTLITKALDDGILKIPPPILSRVYQTISRGFVNLLNTKKITDTKFPYPFAQIIAVFLLVHILLTPALISASVPHRFLAPVFTFLAVFGMFSLMLGEDGASFFVCSASYLNIPRNSYSQAEYYTYIYIYMFVT